MKIGTFGLNRKYMLGQVCKGDKVVCCAGKSDWKIIGIGTATTDYYVDDTKVFLADGIFPDRFDFSAEPIKKNSELDLMRVIDDLSFVTNVTYWSVFFRSGIVKMQERDWQLLKKTIEFSQAS